MKFTIIMASYNQVHYIRQSIESVLNQTHQDFELIIVDGYSTDGSQEIINSFSKELKIKIIIEKDRGIYHARNKALLLATGDVIGFLNTDDFYEENALEIMNNVFIDNLNVDIAYGIINVIDKNGIFIKTYGDFEFDKEKLIKENIALPDQVTFFRKNILPIIGLYDSNFSIIGDWDFWQRGMSLGLRFTRIKDILANYRHYEEALTFNQKFTNTRFKENVKLYRKYNDNCVSTYIIKIYYWHYIKRPLKNIKLIEKIYRKFKS